MGKAEEKKRGKSRQSKNTPPMTKSQALDFRCCGVVGPLVGFLEVSVVAALEWDPIFLAAACSNPYLDLLLVGLRGRDFGFFICCGGLSCLHPRTDFTAVIRSWKGGVVGSHSYLATDFMQ